MRGWLEEARRIVEGMWGTRGSLWWGLLPVLYPSSIVYRSVMVCRSLLYRYGIMPSYSVPLKVISVGNISIGGTGKTPLVIYIARLLSESGHRVAVLSRGYGGSMDKEVNLVSDGECILAMPDEAGDEPFLIASKLKGIPVLTGSKRARLALYAHEHFGTDVAIMDDGFQHIGLKRDVDILILSPDIQREHLLPMGRLREPLSAIDRADILMLRCGDDYIDPKCLFNDYGLKKKPVFSFRYRPLSLRDIKGGSDIGVESIIGRKVFAFSGIGAPSSFINTLGLLKPEVIQHISFPDHHRYTGKDISEILERAKGFDMIVTTEKDGVKIAGILSSGCIYTLGIDIDIDDREGFNRVLDESIDG